MNTFTVAILQILPANSRDGNLQKGIEFCRKAKNAGADLALFPEMFSCGYDIPEDLGALQNLAIHADDPFISDFGQLAKELDMAIGITFLEKHDPLPRNTLRVFDRHGKEVLTYAKVHTCDFGEECRLSPGEDFYTAELDTAGGPVRIGAMICYDREFPESARILMLKGAEILLVPNACPMELNRISQLRGRAFENMLGIVTVNYPYPHPDCNGHSTAFDGIAYRPDGSWRDTLVVEAGEEEGLYLAPFPMDALRQYRKDEVHGNAYRRPEKYGILLDSTVREPFVRADKRK